MEEWKILDVILGTDPRINPLSFPFLDQLWAEKHVPSNNICNKLQPKLSTIQEQSWNSNLLSLSCWQNGRALTMKNKKIYKKIPEPSDKMYISDLDFCYNLYHLFKNKSIRCSRLLQIIIQFKKFLVHKV